MASEATKDLVGRWFRAGPSSAEGRAMVTEDFKWIGPPSMAELFGSPDATLHGPESLADLPRLDKALYRGYEADHGSSNVHFLIAEGDVAVMEFDAAFTTHEGEPYHNQYCLVIKVRGDKVCEVREHADTHYSHEVCMGTPQKRAGVFDRLAKLRAEA
jgi:ketosteroid isomerase-like protein